MLSCVNKLVGKLSVWETQANSAVVSIRNDVPDGQSRMFE